MKANPCPMRLNILLAPYFKNGSLWFENEVLVGKAADGQIVAIGNVGEWQQIESYLKARPNPKDW